MPIVSESSQPFFGLVANAKFPDIAERIDIASWISVVILPLCIFLLISYAVLPSKWTNRHYLSICFTLGICCMQASLAGKPAPTEPALTIR
jgi:hypothetical protein